MKKQEICEENIQYTQACECMCAHRDILDTFCFYYRER